LGLAVDISYWNNLQTSDVFTQARNVFSPLHHLCVA
jgi:hypothetical protein